MTRVSRIIMFLGSVLLAIAIWEFLMYACLGGRADISKEFQLMVYLIIPCLSIPIVFLINIEDIWYGEENDK